MSTLPQKRRRLPEWLIPAVFLSIGIGGVLSSGRGGGETATLTPSAKRQIASPLLLKDLEGKQWRLTEKRGHVVLINYWATWCPPCRAETPDLVSLDHAYRSRGLEMVGIAMDEGGTSAVRPFVREYGIAYPIALGAQLPATDALSIPTLPTTLLIDRKGRVAGALVGKADGPALRATIDRLLAEP